MTRRIGTFRTGTRHKLKKKLRTQGKISFTDYFADYKLGERVVLKPEPAVQKGMFHPKYIGKTGMIKSKQGDCYTVLIKDEKKSKTVIAHPVHLKRLKN